MRTKIRQTCERSRELREQAIVLSEESRRLCSEATEQRLYATAWAEDLSIRDCQATTIAILFAETLLRSKRWNPRQQGGTPIANAPMGSASIASAPMAGARPRR